MHSQCSNERNICNNLLRFVLFNCVERCVRCMHLFTRKVKSNEATRRIAKSWIIAIFSRLVTEKRGSCERNCRKRQIYPSKMRLRKARLAETTISYIITLTCKSVRNCNDFSCTYSLINRSSLEWMMRLPSTNVLRVIMYYAGRPRRVTLRVDIASKSTSATITSQRRDVQLTSVVLKHPVALVNR